MWQGKITKFFQKASSKGRSKDKVSGGYKEPERLATQEWLRDVSHSLAVVGWGWSCFRRTSEDKRPLVMVLCTDQEATQLAAVNYLKFGRSLFVEHVNDPAHRSHNDVHLAMAAAGLLTFGIVSIGLYNVRYGPWNKGGWFGKIQAMADEMSRSMDPSDPLLLSFFPDILSDEGRSQEENTQESRRAFLESLPNRSFVRSKGSKASQSRFNSLSTAHAELDRDWSAFSLVLVVICVAEGWCKTAAELWSPSSGVAEGAGTSRAAAKSAARKAVQQQRGRSVNTLHGMTMFACNQDNRSLARTVHFVLEPENVRCSKMLQELRSSGHRSAVLPVGSLGIHGGGSRARRQALGLGRSQADRPRHVLRAAEGGRSRGVPGVAGCRGSQGRSPHSETLAISLRQPARFDERLGGVGRLAARVCWSPTVEPSLSRRGRPDGPACGGRRVPRGEAPPRGPPGHGTRDGPVARGLASGVVRGGSPGDVRLGPPFVERPLELEAEQRNGTSKTLGRLEGWHGLSRKKLLESYKRTEVGSGHMATVPTKFEADQRFVRPKRLRAAESSSSTAAPVHEEDTSLVDQTIEDDVLKGVSQARTWASPTPESEQDKLAGFSLLAKVVKENLDWSFVEKGWWATLAPEGHALQFATGPPLYVVRTYKRAAFVWPGRLQTSPAGDMVCLELENPGLGWVHLFDEAVDVLDLVATSPQRGLSHLAPDCYSSFAASGMGFQE